MNEGEHEELDLLPFEEQLEKLRAICARYGVRRASDLPTLASARRDHLVTHGHHLSAGCCRPSD